MSLTIVLRMLYEDGHSRHYICKFRKFYISRPVLYKFPIQFVRLISNFHSGNETKQNKQYREMPSNPIASTLLQPIARKKPTTVNCWTHNFKYWKCQTVFLLRQGKLPQSHRMGSEQTIFTWSSSCWHKAQVTPSRHSAPCRSRIPIACKTGGAARCPQRLFLGLTHIESWLKPSN